MRPFQIIALFIFACLVIGCEPGPIIDDVGEDDETADEVDSTGDTEGEPLECVWPDGETWGACPTDPTTGLPHLCNEGIACLPTDQGNICLPVGVCPEDPGFGTEISLGWGDLCYPRCNIDSDCAPGMVCDVGTWNGENSCAWPLD